MPAAGVILKMLYICKMWAAAPVRVSRERRAAPVAVLFTLLLVALFLFIYVTKRQILVIKFYGKSKLLEMHMASVHKIEMKFWHYRDLIKYHK